MADRLSCTAGHRTEAADFAVASGKPIAQVAADLGINEKILGRWVTVRKKELANHPVAAAAAKTETAEMRAARKCMRELELENEFLKRSLREFVWVVPTPRAPAGPASGPST